MNVPLPGRAFWIRFAASAVLAGLVAGALGYVLSVNERGARAVLVRTVPAYDPWSAYTNSGLLSDRAKTALGELDEKRLIDDAVDSLGNPMASCLSRDEGVWFPWVGRNLGEDCERASANNTESTLRRNQLNSDYRAYAAALCLTQVMPRHVAASALNALAPDGVELSEWLSNDYRLRPAAWKESESGAATLNQLTNRARVFASTQRNCLGMTDVVFGPDWQKQPLSTPDPRALAGLSGALQSKFASHS